MTGLAFPKPEKRGPKPRKPIQGSGRPKRSGKRIPRVTQTPRGKEEAALNAMWSRYIKARDPICRLRFHCHGALTTDACHVYAKGPHPHIRWEIANGVGGCRKCHNHFDRSMTQDDRENWALEHIGESALSCLIFLRVYRQTVDRKEARAYLVAALKYRRAA